MNPAKIRGRFAPTPSGRMHLGNISALLIAWLDARSAGGEFILRIEDLDRDRCRPEYTEQLLRDLETLGFDYDGTPVRQSERSEYYSETLAKLAEKANIYECFCTRAELHSAALTVDPDSNAPHSDAPVYSGRCKTRTADEIALLRKQRSPALRIEVPDRTIRFTDARLGEYSENLAKQCGDFILRRSDGGWAYQLAVVADDLAQGVTHIVRGRDLISSTPRQIWLYELLGGSVPEYMHVPLLLAHDGRRLSKRERDMEAGALLASVEPAVIIGKLAWLLGIQPSPEPVMPCDLVPLYRRGNIVKSDVTVPHDLF